MCWDVQFSPPAWNEVASRKHRRTGGRCLRLWERSIIAAQTGDADEPAVYDPRLTADAIRDMEMECVSGLGIELPRTIPHVRRFYRVFDWIVGASDGKKTDCIFVQYNSDGAVHGYPATREYLRGKGANDL